MIALLLLLAGPVIIPPGQPLPPWPAWACETGPPVTTCQFNPEGYRP